MNCGGWEEISRDHSAGSGLSPIEQPHHLFKQMYLWLFKKPNMSLNLRVTHWGMSEWQESHFPVDRKVPGF